MFRKLIAIPSLAVLLCCLAIAPHRAFADGTESLGPHPAGFDIPSTGIIAKGVGLFSQQPSFLNVLVPLNAQVKQVLLYWNGYVDNFNDADLGNKIFVNGIGIDGNRIGGPENVDAGFGFRWASTYRRDITGVNLIRPGSNTLRFEGLNFNGNNGAGVLVTFDDFSQVAVPPQILDGQDYAFVPLLPHAPDPVHEQAIPQTFTFTASTSARIAELSLLFADGSDGPITGRPSVIDISVDGVLKQQLINPLASYDGASWDSVNVDVEVPAGSTSITVLPRSANLTPYPPPIAKPASFFWIAAGLTLRNPASLHTINEGGWGSKPAGKNPGSLLSANFSSVFPGGVVIGGGNTLTFTGQPAIQNFLPVHGTVGMLASSSTNPTSSTAGDFAGEVLALQLNVKFSEVEVLPLGLGRRVLASGPLVGWTVSNVLRLANDVLGGNTFLLPPTLTVGGLNDLLAAISGSFN